jgi:hypothetical protein
MGPFKKQIAKRLKKPGVIEADADCSGRGSFPGRTFAVTDAAEAEGTLRKTGTSLAPVAVDARCGDCAKGHKVLALKLANRDSYLPSQV